MPAFFDLIVHHIYFDIDKHWSTHEKVGYLVTVRYLCSPKVQLLLANYLITIIHLRRNTEVRTLGTPMLDTTMVRRPWRIIVLQCEKGSCNNLTFSPVWFLCGGGARVRGCEQVLVLARGDAVSGQFSDIRLGSCFTRMAVRSWLNDHMPSDSEERNNMLKIKKQKTDEKD